LIGRRKKTPQERLPVLADAIQWAEENPFFNVDPMFFVNLGIEDLT
jgi:hypothetical protein